MIVGMEGISLTTFIPGAIMFVLGGGLTALITVWVSHRNNTRNNDRADRSEDRADQQGVVELTKIMQEMTQVALKQAREDVARMVEQLDVARRELQEARAVMDRREVEHQRVTGRLTRRVQQLVDALRSAGLAVPAELPEPDR